MSPKPDHRRPAAAAYRQWYKTQRWQDHRAAHIHGEPLCRMCKAAGILNAGTLRSDGSYQSNPRRHHLVADHIEPHRGDHDRFWNGELQTLCPDHHDSTKQRMEKSGQVVGNTADGRPTDPDHPWNAR